MKRKIAIEKLWGLVNRIDTCEKAIIAEQYIKKCDLSNDEFDELMMAISFIYRECNKEQRYK